MSLIATNRKTAISNPSTTTTTARGNKSSNPKKRPQIVELEKRKAQIDSRLLYAGLDTSWFERIKSELSESHPNWLCLQSSDCDQALTSLASASFAAVLVDFRIPEALKLLNSSRERFPGVVAVLLCNLQDRAETSTWQLPGVTLAAYESDAANILDTVRRTYQVSQWLTDPAMKKLLTLTHKLPTLPRLHSQIAAELQSPDGSLEMVASLISQDPMMSAKLLQMVNSAFFALSYTVADPCEAVLIIGAVRTRALILLTGVFSQFDKVRCAGFSAEAMWKHSLEVGALARVITLTETNDHKLAEAAFTAGLLHDAGKLILASNAPDMYSTIQHLQRNKQISLREAEMEIIGTTHAELGACLLGTWSLPMAILEAIAWHHCPALCGDHSFSLLTAVHAANVLFHENYDKDADSFPYRLDEAYLLKIGLNNRRNVWRDACGFPEKLDEATQEEMARRRQEAKEN